MQPHREADFLWGELSADVGSCAAADTENAAVIFIDLPHQARCIVDVGFRPDVSFRIRAEILREFRERVPHGEAVLFCHILRIRGVVRSDHGLSVGHRLRDGQAESLRAVERDVRVAEGEQAMHFLSIHVPVDECNIRSFRGIAQAADGSGVGSGVDIFDDERCRIAGMESPSERVNGGKRVFAFENAQNVEHKEEEAVMFRQAEVSA